MCSVSWPPCCSSRRSPNPCMPPSPYLQMPWLPMPTSRNDSQPCRLRTRTASFSFKKNNKCRCRAGIVFLTHHAPRGTGKRLAALQVAQTQREPRFARRFLERRADQPSLGGSLQVRVWLPGALRTGFGSRRLSTLGSSTPCLGGTGGSAPETAWSGFMRLRKKRRRIRGRWKSLHPVISWKDFQRPEGLRLPEPRIPRCAPVDCVANTPENTSARIAGLRACGAAWPPGGCPLSGSLIFV